jgi:hypothetical protein
MHVRILEKKKRKNIDSVCIIQLPNPTAVMESRKLDSMEYRTEFRTVLSHDCQQSIGTHFEKDQASRPGGHSYSPINFKTEEILAHSRNKRQYISEHRKHNGMLI